MKTLDALLGLKVTLLKNGFLKLLKKSRLELAVLVVFLAGTAAGLYALFSWSLRFFHSQEPFGPVLIDETFYLFTFALMLMLFISSAVAAYSSLFRSGEVTFLIPLPLPWSRIFYMKLAEILWLSSWSMILVALPFIAAYGQIQNAPVWFSVFSLLCFFPLIVISGTLGTLTTLALMLLLPGRKSRRIALGLFLFTAISILAGIQPELIKEQGSLAGVLSGYLPHVAMAKNAFLPSCWVTRGIIEAVRLPSFSLLASSDALFYFSLLLSNALFLLIPAGWAGSRIYPSVFFRVQDHGEAQTLKRVQGPGRLERLADSLPWPSRPMMALFEKDIKTFVRDPSEWSQILIFFGLLVLYFANLRNLEFHILKDMWKNLVFVLNTVGTYIVLSSFSMRFIFPMLSLEGSRFWIIGLSPVGYPRLLLEKFILGGLLSAVLTLPLITLSGFMLEMPQEKVFFTTGLGVFVCLALTGLSVGFGALFPNFKSTNPAEIISGAGGSLLLAAHLLYLAASGLFLAFLPDPGAIPLLIAGFVSLLIAVIPLYAGVLKLKRQEF